MLRDHGQAKKYYHDVEGYNGRLDAIQAGFLRIKLRHLAEWNEKRRAAARNYRELFEADSQGIVLPHEPDWTWAIYHLFVVRIAQREEAMKHLALAGVGTGIHYPIPLHLQKAYQYLGYKPGDFPVAENVASEILSLPMFPGLTNEQQGVVVAQLQEFVIELAADETREAAA